MRNGHLQKEQFSDQLGIYFKLFCGFQCHFIWSEICLKHGPGSTRIKIHTKCPARLETDVNVNPLSATRTSFIPLTAGAAYIRFFLLAHQVPHLKSSSG